MADSNDSIEFMSRYPCVKLRHFKLYITGSMENPDVMILANRLRLWGVEVFDEWISTGKDSDRHWQNYAQQRKMKWGEALKLQITQTSYHLDKRNILDSDAVVMLMPAGCSAFFEMGMALSAGKKCYVILPAPEKHVRICPACDYVEPKKWDIMIAEMETFEHDEIDKFVACILDSCLIKNE
jgi:hypothetical protein